MRLDAPAAQRKAASTPLPLPYPQLARSLRLYPGQTSLTVAAPGVGKSQLWANIAHRSKAPTLYWSADTDPHDVRLRAIALWTGLPVVEIEGRLSDAAWEQFYTEHLGSARHIEWVFDSSITAKRLQERLLAFAEKYGQYPALVVVDNLSNAIDDPNQEYAQMKEVLIGLQRLARETRAHVAALAHAKGSFDDGTRPIPQSGGLQNPFKIPEVGLTLFSAGPGQLGVCIVKNRGGVSDPAARSPIVLQVDYARATVRGFAA